MSYATMNVAAIGSTSRRAAGRRGHGAIRFGRSQRRRRRAVRPAIVIARVLELCLLVGIIVALAASVVRIH